MKVKQILRSVLKKHIILALLLNVIMLVILSMISYPRYEQDVDIMMQSMLYNVVGNESSSYILFMNIFLAKFMKMLIETFDSVAWYSVIQYVAIFVSLVSISYLYLKKSDVRLRRTVLMIFLFFVGYECYIRPSYLKTSSILCIAGLFLLSSLITSDLENIVKKVLESALSITLLIFSGMFSWRAFEYTLIIMTTVLLLNFILKRKKAISYVYFLLTVIAIFSFLCGLNSIDGKQYIKQADKINGYEFKNAVEKVVMFGYPEYTKEIGDEIKVSETDYILACKGSYLCRENVGLEIVDKIASIKMDINFKTILKFFRTIPINVFRVAIFYLVIIMAFLLYVSESKSKVLVFCSSIIGMLGYFVAFVNYGWNNTNAHFMILVPIATSFLMTLHDMKEIELKNLVIWLTVFSVVLYNKFSGLIVSSIVDTDMKETLYQNVVEENDNSVCCVDIISFLRMYSIFEKYSEGLLDEYSIVLLNGNYLVYSMFDEYQYGGEWTDETPIIWLDVWRDYKGLIVERSIE